MFAQCVRPLHLCHVQSWTGQGGRSPAAAASQHTHNLCTMEQQQHLQLCQLAEEEDLRLSSGGASRTSSCTLTLDSTPPTPAGPTSGDSLVELESPEMARQRQEQRRQFAQSEQGQQLQTAKAEAKSLATAIQRSAILHIWLRDQLPLTKRLLSESRWDPALQRRADQERQQVLGLPGRP